MRNNEKQDNCFKEGCLQIQIILAGTKLESRTALSGVMMGATVPKSLDIASVYCLPSYKSWLKADINCLYQIARPFDIKYS